MKWGEISVMLWANWQTLLYRSVLYDVYLGHKPPRSLTPPRFNGTLSAQAFDAADLVPRKPPLPFDPRFRHFEDAARLSISDAATSLNQWLNNNDRWQPDTWGDDIIGERLVRWTGSYDLLLAHMDEPQRNAWSQAIRRSGRHLWHTRMNGNSPWRRLVFLQARLFASLSLPSLTKFRERALKEFGAAIDAQILGDGGHVERSPARALAVLCILLETRDALMHLQVEPPVGLVFAIDRIAPFIRMMRHGDGGFALVNRTTSDTGALIDEALAASGSRARAMADAPHSGFARLRAGQTLVLLDAGGPESGAPGSFELSSGKSRLFGHCGARRGTGKGQDRWCDALSRTAAHTALVVGDTNAVPSCVPSITRREHDGARLAELSHDGFKKTFGITHQRALYVAAGGTDVRGEDVLEGGRAAPVAVRFHLHPDARAVMVEGGGEVIIKPARGRAWRFMSNDPVMLEDSVSFHDGSQHRAQQIVILGNHEPAQTTIKWRITTE